MGDLLGSGGGGRNNGGGGGSEDYRGGSGAAGAGAGRGGGAGPRTKLLYVTPEKLAKSGSLAAALKALASRWEHPVVDEPPVSRNIVGRKAVVFNARKGFIGMLIFSTFKSRPYDPIL